MWSTRPTYQSMVGLKTKDENPITIRLSSRTGEEFPDREAEYYILATGLYKLLSELNVIEYRHSLINRKLVFYLQVKESKSVVRSYLQKLGQFHMLGPAWDFEIIDSGRLFPLNKEVTHRLAENMDIENLVKLHMSLGSRPLRFSKYFLYSSLSPFCREWGYGSCLAGSGEAGSGLTFYHVLQALNLMQKSFRAIDFSSMSSVDEMEALIRPLAGALADIYSKEEFFLGLLYSSISLAWAYERKKGPEDISENISLLAPGLIKSLKRYSDAFSKNRFSTIIDQLSGGFKDLSDMLKAGEISIEDLDDLSLDLFCRFKDRSSGDLVGSSSLGQLQKVADLARKGQGVKREEVNSLFIANGLRMDDVRDLIIILQILNCIGEED